MTLAQALDKIEKKHLLPVQMIEFEDGSGLKFNYRLSGEKENRFISFQPINEFLGFYSEVKKIVNKF